MQDTELNPLLEERLEVRELAQLRVLGDGDVDVRRVLDRRVRLLLDDG